MRRYQGEKHGAFSGGAGTLLVELWCTTGHWSRSPFTFWTRVHGWLWFCHLLGTSASWFVRIAALTPFHAVNLCTLVPSIRRQVEESMTCACRSSADVTTVVSSRVIILNGGITCFGGNVLSINHSNIFDVRTYRNIFCFSFVFFLFFFFFFMYETWKNGCKNNAKLPEILWGNACKAHPPTLSHTDNLLTDCTTHNVMGKRMTRGRQCLANLHVYGVGTDVKWWGRSPSLWDWTTYRKTWGDMCEWTRVVMCFFALLVNFGC